MRFAGGSTRLVGVGWPLAGSGLCRSGGRASFVGVPGGGATVFESVGDRPSLVGVPGSHPTRLETRTEESARARVVGCENRRRNESEVAAVVLLEVGSRRLCYL